MITAVMGHVTSVKAFKSHSPKHENNNQTKLNDIKFVISKIFKDWRIFVQYALFLRKFIIKCFFSHYFYIYFSNMQQLLSGFVCGCDIIHNVWDSSANLFTNGHP